MNLNVRDGRRCSPADAFLRPVMGSENLTVLTGAQTVKLTLRGTRCTGVDFLLDGEPHSVGASREVILCAGAIHTPRLLMLSGIGPPADLATLGIAPVVDLPGVGRNLQDHVLVAGLCFEAKHPLPPPSNNLGGSVAFWKSRPALDVPDLMVLPMQVPFVSDEIAATIPDPAERLLHPAGPRAAPEPGLPAPEDRGGQTARSRSSPTSWRSRPTSTPWSAGVELGLEIASQPAFRDLIGRRVAPPRSRPEPGRDRGVHSPRLLHL